MRRSALFISPLGRIIVGLLAFNLGATAVRANAGDASAPPPPATAASTGGLNPGDPTPLSRREATLPQFTFEIDVHYGLVGTGPTRLTNDIRFAIFDWWELRTSLSPYPAALMSRFRIGSQNGRFGALILDGGLASFDAGFRLVDDSGEPEAGIRFHFEAGAAYARTLGPRLAVYASLRTRVRLSMLSDDTQNAVAGDVHLTYDLLPNVAITGGVGYAEVVGTKVREIVVPFVEVGRPGMTHFLMRDDGWSRSVTVPFALTYGRTESFDVDLFLTPRIWPQWDLLFGAGLRWRI